MGRRFIEAAIAFLKRRERPLATLLFISGFITDLLTFGFLELGTVIVFFSIYLALAVIASIIGHAAWSKTGRLSRALAVLMPLLAQFVFGSLLSGFLIFYAKSAVIAVSWPFLILLAIVLFGNEVFRNYRNRLIFQTILVFFSLYAFAIFALPLYLHRLGKIVFLQSTAIALLLFAAYLVVLALADWKRLKDALLGILVSTTAIAVLIVGSYLAGLLPPLPLTLKSGGIYQSIIREDGGYTVEGESVRAWWDPRPQDVHHLPGTPLYAYSAIFAPGSFSTSVVHVWQLQSEETGTWTTESTVAFSLSGGREGGYRGYSIKADPIPGTWRVLVQTIDGQTIGQFKFTVENVPTVPALQTERL